MRRILLLLALTSCIDGDQMIERDEPEIPPFDLSSAQTGDFAAFMACMNYDDFVASNMAPAWSTIAMTNQTGTCTGCHTADGMFSGDAQEFFDTLKQRTYVQVQFFTFDRVNDVVDVNEETIPRVGKAVVPYTEHPRFNANKGLDATYALYQRTMTRLASNNCK